MDCMVSVGVGVELANLLSSSYDMSLSEMHESMSVISSSSSAPWRTPW